MKPDVDVVIAGAGPAGLALACELLRWQIPFRIFDLKSEPEPHSKAGSFWPKTQESLAGIGVLDRILPHAQVLHTVTLHAYGKHIANLPIGPYPSPYGQAMLVGQNIVEHQLSDVLSESGQAVEYNCKVLTVSQQADGVEVTVECSGIQKVLSCRYFVNAAGGGNTLRDQVGLSIETEKMPERSIHQVDARLRWSRTLSPDHLWLFLFDTGYIGIFAVDHHHYRVWLLQDEKAMPAGLPTLNEMQAAMRDIIGDPTIELSDAIWSSYGRFQHGVAKAFQSGRVLLVGDAAHVTMPIGGQGLNTGIQDAFNLGWKLAYVLKDWAPSSLLDTYSPERQHVRSELDKDQADGFRRLMYPNILQKTAMRWFGSFLVQKGGAELGSSRDQSQLDIAYPDSPLAEDHLDNHDVRAGDRAPDAVVYDTHTGQTRHLFDYLYSGKWNLLVFDTSEGDEARYQLHLTMQQIAQTFPQIQSFLLLAKLDRFSTTEKDVAVLFDLDRFAHDVYAVQRTSFYLIRPDGHVAFRSGVNQREALEAFCYRWLVPKELSE